jgi:hypothetical protein
VPQNGVEAIPQFAPLEKVIPELPDYVWFDGLRCAVLIGKPLVEASEQSKILSSALPCVALLSHVLGVNLDRGTKRRLGERLEGPNRCRAGEKEI